MSIIDITQQELYKLFENKSIAVVGNAQSLYNSQYGALIDTYDIVCRFNLGINHQSYKTHGCKIDWCIYNNDAWAYNINLFDNQITNWMRVDDELPSEIEIHTDRYTMPSSILEKLKQEGKMKKPSTGLTFLYFLTHTKPKRVGVFGFDWKQTITFYNLNRKRKKEERKKYKDHDWEKEKVFFQQRIVLENSNFYYYTN